MAVLFCISPLKDRNRCPWNSTWHTTTTKQQWALISINKSLVSFYIYIYICYVGRRISKNLFYSCLKPFITGSSIQYDGFLYIFRLQLNSHSSLYSSLKRKLWNNVVILWFWVKRVWEEEESTTTNICAHPLFDDSWAAVAVGKRSRAYLLHNSYHTMARRNNKTHTQMAVRIYAPFFM